MINKCRICYAGIKKMTWDEIQDLLQNFSFLKLKTKNNTLDYSGLALFAQGNIEPVLNVIWFAPYSVWQNISEQARDGQTFILYRDAAARLESMPDENLILLNDESDWLSCYKVLLAEFDNVYKIKSGILDLITFTTSNAELHRISNKVSELYGAPMSIIDNSFSFVAVSDDFITLPFMNLRQEFETGALNLEAQGILRSNEFVYPRRMRRSTVYFDFQFTDGSMLRNYLTLIYIRNIQVGSFSIITTPDKPLPKCRTNLLPAFAQIISLEMQKGDFHLLNKATFYSHMLLQALDPARPIDQNAFQKSLNLFGYDLKRYKHIIFIDFSDEDFEIHQIMSFAEQFRTSIPNSIYMIYECNILYLKSSDDDISISESEISNWIEIIAQTNLKIGISSMFEDVSQMRSCLKQATNVIATGRRLPATIPVYNFDTYRLADMVAHMPDDMDFNYYCYPPMRRLIERDASNGTNLAYTLYKYLENPTNPADVSKELFIHKNTLYYRMDKIREIMQTDLKKADVIAQIQLTFQILKFKNRFASMIERKTD